MSTVSRTLGILVSVAVGLVLMSPVRAHHGAAGLYDMTKAIEIDPAKLADR